MTRKQSCGVLLSMLMMMMMVMPLHAANQPAIATPSAKNGDPPPNDAMSLSLAQARNRLKDSIQKRYLGTIKACQRVLMIKGCWTLNATEANDIRLRAEGFEFAAPYTEKITASSLDHKDGRVSVIFKKDQDYIRAYRADEPPTKGPKYSWEPKILYTVGYLSDPERPFAGSNAFYWSDESAANDFTDAFNRLLYAAYQDEDFLEFHAAAVAWRQNPVKPPLGPVAERHRILAENAIKEHNLAAAVEHYQGALAAQPMWPEGWFNLALIYGEQNNYRDATDRMRHYLELLPDAPDAKGAREQIVIWEDKAKH
jgi:tetratricopeptide (TPR) repeat protein